MSGRAVASSGVSYPPFRPPKGGKPHPPRHCLGEVSPRQRRGCPPYIHLAPAFNMVAPARLLIPPSVLPSPQRGDTPPAASLPGRSVAQAKARLPALYTFASCNLTYYVHINLNTLCGHFFRSARHVAFPLPARGKCF